MEFRDRVDQGFSLVIQRANEVARVGASPHAAAFYAWANALREAHQLWREEAGAVDDATPKEILWGAIEAVIICEANMPHMPSGMAPPEFIEGGLLPQWLTVLTQIDPEARVLTAKEAPFGVARQIAVQWILEDNPDRCEPEIRAGLDSAACALVCQTYDTRDEVIQEAQGLLRRVGDADQTRESLRTVSAWQRVLAEDRRPRDQHRPAQSRPLPAGALPVPDISTPPKTSDPLSASLAVTVGALTVLMRPPKKEDVVALIARAVAKEVKKPKKRRSSRKRTGA